MKIILASASPRRRELLKHIIPDFNVEVSTADEVTDKILPREIVCDLARKKAVDVGTKNPQALIIAADTLVFLDGKPLGKPADAEDALRMLSTLSGRAHEVFTGVALALGDKIICDYDRTIVHFDVINPTEIEKYISTGDPFDKAGAYGIQSGAGIFIKKIDGCYFNVMGLPLNKLYRLYESFWEDL